MRHRFQQVDVFTTTGLYGNPVAVVFDADGLSDAEMQRFANWTNLSETTFLLQPTEPAADYRLRIFTPAQELPFAGHPTLGSCQAWLHAGGTPKRADVVQECAVGLVRIRMLDEGLAFAAPPVNITPARPEQVERTARALGLDPARIDDAALLNNGPEFLCLLLSSADDVLDLRPNFTALAKLPKTGVIGPYPQGAECRYEVRGFAPSVGVNEDPVTGSLNAMLAQWLVAEGRAGGSYTVAQGTVLGRAGRVQIECEHEELIWVGGGCVVCVEGTVTL